MGEGIPDMPSTSQRQTGIRMALVPQTPICWLKGSCVAQHTKNAWVRSGLPLGSLGLEKAETEGGEAETARAPQGTMRAAES